MTAVSAGTLRIPSSLDADGQRFVVNRAWPTGARIAIEARDESRCEIRAGWWDGHNIDLLAPGHDPKLPALQEFSTGTTIVSHRPGRRAVVRNEDAERFVKVVRPGRASRILAGIDRAAGFTTAFRSPTVVDHDDSTVTFAAISGSSVHDTAAAVDGGTWVDIWAEFSTRWREAILTPVRSCPLHTADDEIIVIRGWIQQAERIIGPVATTALLERASSVFAELANSSEPATAPSHRDLHDKQLLWDASSGLALIDVDTACQAEAALDLGNLRAHALLREWQGVYSAEQAGIVRDTVDQLADQLGVPQQRLAAYEAGTLIRLGCVYAFRPAWTEVAANLRGLR